MRQAESGPIISLARLHPSMLWIPSVEQLRTRLGDKGIAPTLAVEEGRVHFWDTLSDAYETHSADCRAFSSDQLDCFDHLFFGAHLLTVDAWPTTALTR